MAVSLLKGETAIYAYIAGSELVLTVLSSQKWAALSETTYSWDTHEATTIWKLLDIQSGAQTVLPYDGDVVTEVAWAGPTNTSIIYLNSTAGDIPGGVTMYTADVLSPNQTTLVASLDAQYAGLKAVNTPSGGIAWLANAMAYANGSAYNEEMAETPLSTARFFEVSAPLPSTSF